jgi:hypothetical protein
MKTINLLILLVFFSWSSFSQTSMRGISAARPATVTNFSAPLLGKTYLDNATVSSMTLEGSPYLFANWKDLYVLVPKNGESRKISNMNYNLISKTLELYISKDSVFQLDLDRLDYVITPHQKYKVINEGKLKGLFFEAFSGNNIKLFRETNVFIVNGVLNPRTNDEIFEQDKFEKKQFYYFFVNNKYEKVKLVEKNILKYLRDKVDLVNEFVSKNKLSYTSEKDVITILNYYDLL